MSDVATLRVRLSASAEAIAALARGIGDARARWKPAPEEWSILEVVNHLHDEECEDFRVRLDLTLRAPDEAWPPIDPERWAAERGYNTRDPAASLEAFLRERQVSLAWLGSLDHADWTSVHRHPEIGAMTAADVLTAWVAHDHLHIRQLNQLHFQYLARDSSPVALRYAGGW
jgi:hypothetical protein